jgi:hypothetical protein
VKPKIKDMLTEEFHDSIVDSIDKMIEDYIMLKEARISDEEMAKQIERNGLARKQKIGTQQPH